MAESLEDVWGSEDEHNFGYQEWDKLEQNFINAGYREGITAGKEGALQEGFDAGFAGPGGAPLGRQIGTLRGIASALMAYLDSPSFPPLTNPSSDSQYSSTTIDDSLPPPALEDLRSQTRGIVRTLASLRIANLAPVDEEALNHAREHLDADDGSKGAALNDEIDEDGMNQRREDGRKKVEQVKADLKLLLTTVGLPLDMEG